MSKFIQIATCTSSDIDNIVLYALDDKGYVWSRDSTDRQWIRLSNDRQEIKNKK